MTVVPSRPGPGPGVARARSRHLGVVVALAGLVVTALLPVAATPVAAAAGSAGEPVTGAAPPPGFGEPGIPVRPASERYVREAYDAVLGRTVDEPSLTYWGDRLDTTTSRGTFARHVVLSIESVRAHVAAIYEDFGRPPTTAERDASVAAIRSRTTTVERELIRLLATAEFYEREGGASPSGFVQALYNSVLHRSPDEAGSAYWLDRLESGATRVQVAQGFVLADARLGPVVADAYDRILARGADPGGRTYWAARIRRGEGIVDIDRFLLASGEAWGAGCSILDRTRCLLPFPNDELTLADPTTDTGRRVVLKPPWVPGSTSTAFDPTEWNRQDGFSPGSAVLLHSGGIDPDESGLPGLDDIGASLDDDAPIVIVDTETGEEWPYWAELDSNAPTDAERALIIRPARNFLDGHTYAVGIGEMHDDEGDPITAPAGFRIFRDDLPSNSRRVEEERVRVEYAIDQVAAAGLDRTKLHMAWTFTVASTRNLAERAVHIRDETLGGMAGLDAADFTVTSQTDEGDWTRVQGTFQVPLYLTGTGQPGSRLRLGDDDLPQAQGTTTAPFTCVVPDSARTTPARAGLYGHGLLGTGTQAASGGPRDVAREHNMVFCGTDYIGMAADDIAPPSLYVAQIIGNLSKFPELVDRNQQGLLNFQVLGRLMTLPDGLVSHAAFKGNGGAPAISGTDLTYYGISQGGIMGGALVALSTDITRGVLGVPGTNYSTLLERSVDFDPFFGVMANSYPSALDRVMMLSVIQMLWDRGEANGYANHMTTDPLPGTPVHEVLMHIAVGDHQVATAAADVMARTYGAATNDPPLVEDRSPDVEPLWGIDRIESWPYAGSATIYWDSGAAWPPLENKPAREGDDPHGDPRADANARDQISEFLEPGGLVVDACEGAPCMVEP